MGIKVEPGGYWYEQGAKVNRNPDGSLSVLNDAGEELGVFAEGVWEKAETLDAKPPLEVGIA